MSRKFSAALAVAIFFGLAFYAFQFSQKASQGKVLKVLSYSSFLAEWGPAHELAQKFEEQTGVKVEYHDSDDAGLLLAKLELFPSDVVLGFDWLTAPNAKKLRQWKNHEVAVESEFGDEKFLPFDWAPLTFIYREGEIDPPRNLDDLLDTRFKKQISLQDPRTSAPGLLFLYWLIAEKGEDGAFDFLRKLKSNIRAVSPSWSAAYGLFQKGQAKIVFSYATSPVYHWAQENKREYKAAQMSGRHIFQAELAAIPETCVACDEAREFLKFLLTPEAQRIIMQKNVMLPIVNDVIQGTEFSAIPQFEMINPTSLQPSLDKKSELLKRWRELNL